MTYKAPDPGKGWRLLKCDGTEDAPVDMEYYDGELGKWSPSLGRGSKNFFNYFKGSLFYRTREGVKPVKERKPKPYTAKASITVPSDYLKAEKWRRLALRMSKAKTIREARAIWKKGVGK